MKIRLLVVTFLLVAAAQASAGEGTPFKAVGRIVENTRGHTQRHDHELRFQRFVDSKEFDITDSPQLVNFHCKTGISPVLEVEGYTTDKVLFWGNNLVVNNFKVHEDIEVAAVPHRMVVALPRGGRSSRL